MKNEKELVYRTSDRIKLVLIRKPINRSIIREL